ncbi:hypothetical protein [Desulforhopalus sp. IMCC35007]|uniref:hypothetical protein n=1 Tax=Desulforhopalus sp. IMCC35007 TaxID=2569543 RepID=UPI0010AE9230|nr:hypothetical protein [Desulforhopalus sp. IMCC35007]TKB06929.1 hypothetical protein FCL48_19240 [Desulforhopalus sp. IMCC35007]
MITRLCWSIGLGILLLSSVSLLAAPVPDKKPENWGAEQGDDLPLLAAENEQLVDNAQIQATEFLYQTAEWIDSFFDDGRFSAEDNESRATLKLSMGYSENDNFEIKPRLDVRLKLPKLSSRTQLIIEAAEDTDFNIDDSPVDDYPQHEDSENSQLQAALRFFLKESDTYNFSFDAGGSWDYLYGSFRARAIQDFDDWLGRFTNRLRWYTDDGWENRVTYDLESQFTDELFFRATTSLNYYETRDGFPHSQTFRLYQVLNSIRALSYETGIYFDTEPSYKMSDLRFIVRYRQRFYRDWLILEISPQLNFPEDHDREANPGIIFKLEASFGNNANEEGYKKIFK